MIKGLGAFLKVLGAFLLGLLSLVVFRFVEHIAYRFLGGLYIGTDEVIFRTAWAAEIVCVILMMAYFFICQFILSRGNPHAFLKDWPIMLSLNAAPFLDVFFIFLYALGLEGVQASLRESTFAVEILLPCFVGTLAGAFVASRAARRKGRREVIVAHSRV